MRRFICLAILLVILGGCKQDIPKPKSMSVEASEPSTLAIDHQKATIRHIVQNGDVFVECMVPNISFSGMNKKVQRGKILAYVDGQFKGEYRTAAFVMKGLPKGVHHIKIEIVKPNNKSFGLAKDFYVSVS